MTTVYDVQILLLYSIIVTMLSVTKSDAVAFAVKELFFSSLHSDSCHKLYLAKENG